MNFSYFLSAIERWLQSCYCKKIYHAHADQKSKNIPFCLVIFVLVAETLDVLDFYYLCRWASLRNYWRCWLLKLSHISETIRNRRIEGALDFLVIFMFFIVRFSIIQIRDIRNILIISIANFACILQLFGRVKSIGLSLKILNLFINLTFFLLIGFTKFLSFFCHLFDIFLTPFYFFNLSSLIFAYILNK
jgi:hypothetical protein